MKRIIDIALSLVVGIVLLPAILLIAFLVRTNIGKPVLFMQARPGLYGQPFKMFKFRTMTNQKDAAGKLLDDDNRLTSLGRLLRATSLDELPELWNVLKGDMSLVGPRPLLVEYLPLYSEKQQRRHEVRPGITGWAQVNGRNAISWEEKFDLDVWYVDNHTLWLDIKILFLTVIKVFFRQGINQKGQATMERFTGSVRK